MSQNRAVLFAVFSVSCVWLASAQLSCDTACQAYVWGYPIWHEINQRYLQQTNSPAFQMNAVGARVSAIPLPGTTPQLTLCNATICSGVPIPFYNPSPVVSPNVDTVYGAINWDLGTDPTATWITMVILALQAPAPIRYASIIFYDHFTNVIAEYSAQPTTNIPLCLTRSTPNSNCPAGYVQVVLPRTGFAVLRGYSDGSASPSCGVTGCSYMLGVAQQFVIHNAPAPVVNYTTQYAPYMSAGHCPYVYGQPPCGATGAPGFQNSFWDAICTALADNPLSTSEAAYVDATFTSFGITSTACTPVYSSLNPGIASGFSYVNSKLYDHTTLVSNGPWTFLSFNGNWAVADASTALLRAITSTRLEYMNSNNFAAYWEANTDSTGTPLNAAWGTTYKVVWQVSDAFVDATRGFWSVTAYDSTHYLFNPPSGTDTRQYAVRGTGAPSALSEIHLSNVCVGSSCIRVTPGPFSIMLRAYAPLQNVLPASGPSYTFPTIVKCTCDAPCY